MDSSTRKPQPSGKYKDKFKELRETYTRVSAARANNEKDYQNATAIMKRLQEEINLLLEALLEVSTQEEDIRLSYEQPINGQGQTSYSHPPPPPPPPSAPPSHQ